MHIFIFYIWYIVQNILKYVRSACWMRLVQYVWKSWNSHTLLSLTLVRLLRLRSGNSMFVLNWVSRPDNKICSIQSSNPYKVFAKLEDVFKNCPFFGLQVSFDTFSPWPQSRIDQALSLYVGENFCNIL